MAFDGLPHAYTPRLADIKVEEKAEFINAIELWTKTRKIADALAPDELSILDPGTKIVALWRTSLEGMAHYLRSHPREDATLGVYFAVCVLADAGHGFCSMAQERLGRFFGRSRKHINDCVHRLDGLIAIEKDAGHPDRISPIVPRIFTERGMQSFWIFEALAPHAEKKKPGRKPKDRPISVTPISSCLPVASKHYSPLGVETGTPVTATVTSISTPSGATPAECDKIALPQCGKIEIGVTENRNRCNRTRLHNTPYESPRERKDTIRAFDLSIRRVAKVPGKLDAVSEAWA